MARLWKFILGAVVFEVITLTLLAYQHLQGVLDVVVVVGVLFVLFVFYRSSARVPRVHLPESMTGYVVRKRHWHWF